MKHAPWTDDEVASLNAYQQAGVMHPFTGENGNDLIATTAGWVEGIGGPVVQTWCHPFMADWSWQPKCERCGRPRQIWQRFCGAACSVAHEMKLPVPEKAKGE